MKQVQLSPIGCALVDDEDYELVSKYNWHLTPDGYAITIVSTINILFKRISMHRLILNAPKGLLVDHINHNRLDNRRCNIRLCTRSQNNWNMQRSAHKQYKGVDFQTRHGTYRVAVSVKDISIHIGTYKTSIEAAEAYDRAALYYFKEFACLNSPEKIEEYKKTPYIPRKTRPLGGNKYRGVEYLKRIKRWRGRLYIKDFVHRLGDRYKSVEDAAKAYDIAAIILKGDKAKVNFPDIKYTIDKSLGESVKECIKLNIINNLE